MGKDEFDDFDDDEDEVEEDDEDEKPVKKAVRQPLPVEPKKVGRPEKQSKEVTTFSAFHYPERVGVKNDSTDESVGEDIIAILANIITRLQRIEEAVC